MWNRLFYFLSGFLKAKAIKGPHGEPYLERYMLARWGRHAVFLHRFLASDPDRGLHDHPWSRSISLIVCGGYQEKRLIKRGSQIWMALRRLRAGSINVIRGDDFHQVVLAPGQHAWTVFYHGPRVKPWGFAVSKDCVRDQEGPYATERFEGMPDHASEEAPWEISAPRGRALAGRMPANFCATKI